MTLLKDLKTEGIYWKFAHGLEMRGSNHQVVLLDGHPIPKMIYENPFSVMLDEKRLADLDASKAPFGFYLMKNGIAQKCFFMSNEKQKNYKKCFDIEEQNFDFDGFPLRAHYSDIYNGDNFITQSILDQIAKKSNLTINYQLTDEPNNWGASPKPGCNFSTIECFSGTFYQHVTQKFDFQVNMWYSTSDRRQIVDFLDPFYADYYQLYINDKLIPDKIDWFFYLRPFEKRSWIVTFVTYLVFFLLRFIFSFHSVLMSKTGTTALGWMMYVLIFAYYSGAQTMFLSTPTELSINNLDDVLLSKEWKVAIPKNFEVIIDSYLDTGRKHIEEFHKKLGRGYEHNYDTVGESVEAMQRIPGLVMPMTHVYMNAYFSDENKNNPFVTRGYMMPVNAGTLINQGWPLKSLFNKGINKLKEFGQMDDLLRPLQSRFPEQEYESQFDGITFSEVFTAFGLLLVLSISSVITFLFEMMYHRFH